MCQVATIRMTNQIGCAKADRSANPFHNPGKFSSLAGTLRESGISGQYNIYSPYREALFGASCRRTTPCSPRRKLPF
jgi:hypothetical protein